MRKALPHEFFRLDFDQILEEGKRQEEIHSTNKGEYALVKNMHGYFAGEILPRIVRDDWVFEAAAKFASDYALECFRYLRLGGQEVFNTQNRLLEINGRVVDFLARACIAGFAPSATTVDLVKASDFIDLVEVDKLDTAIRTQAMELYEEAKDHEALQLTVTLRAIRDNYETAFPRIMYVVRRAMKAVFGLPKKKSDDKLLQPADCIDWFVAQVTDKHPFYPVLGENREFLRVARNVGSHHVALEWESGSNTVILRDRNNTLPIHVHEFQQLNRYLVHFCDLGVRGILAAFCERERGVISNSLVKEYNKTFPPGWAGGEEGVVVFCPIQQHF